jgi:hypothetical protein
MYSKVHQKTPVFLLKYCHNKDLKEIELRISVKNSKSAFAEATADPPFADSRKLTSRAGKSEARRPKFTRLRRARIRMAEILMTKTNLP